MKVATKLRAAFAFYITLLAVLLTYHVTTIQGIVTTSYELTAISSRERAASTEQITRIAQLGENAAKYAVTRDRGYLDKFSELYVAYDTALQRLRALPLSEQERKEMQSLSMAWERFGTARVVQERLNRFVRLTSQRAAQDSLLRLQRTLDSIQLFTQQLGKASQAAMVTRLEQSVRTALEAERLSWIAAIAILLFSLVVSALIARSIAEPLQRLTEGTHKVAAGEFEYRLDMSRGDEFAQVAASFNRMTERLGDLDRMKRDFVSQVSHDLKTPLSSMQETINALLDELPGPLTDQQRKLLLLHQQSGKRLASMLAKLLDLSRLEAGIEPNFEMIEVGRLIQHAVEQATPVSVERGLRIDVELPDHQVMIKCDPDRMLQLLDNLLENAMKFSPRAGTVDIGVTTSENRKRGADSYGMMHITVADRGPGVPNDQKERIFERFYQTDAGRAVSGRGVGLGLTICREIASAHGGTIRVTDNPGGGSVFHVDLPGALSMPADRIRAEAAAFLERHGHRQSERQSR